MREEPSPHWEITDQCLFLCLWPTQGSGHESKALMEFNRDNQPIPDYRFKAWAAAPPDPLSGVVLSHIHSQLRRSCFQTFQILQLGFMLITVLSYFWVNLQTRDSIPPNSSESFRLFCSFPLCGKDTSGPICTTHTALLCLSQSPGCLLVSVETVSLLWICESLSNCIKVSPHHDTSLQQPTAFFLAQH